MIILPSLLRPIIPLSPLSLMFYHQNAEYIHLCPMHAICLAHLVLRLIILIIFFTPLQPFTHKPLCDSHVAAK